MTQSLPAHTQFPADWYDDPHAPGGRIKRFWDGIAWTEFVYDLGIDFAVLAPGPREVSPAPVTQLHPQPEQAEVEVEVEVAEKTASDSPEEASDRRKLRFGTRKAARQLTKENVALQRQISELTETVARYEAELEKTRTVPLG